MAESAGAAGRLGQPHQQLLLGGGPSAGSICVKRGECALVKAGIRPEQAAGLVEGVILVLEQMSPRLQFGHLPRFQGLASYTVTVQRPAPDLAGLRMHPAPMVPTARPAARSANSLRSCP